MSEYPYPFLAPEGKIYCQLCGKPFLVISPMHLRKYHGIKYDEYKLRFPDAPLSTDKFVAATKYGREKVLFVEKELDKFEVEADLPKEEIEEIMVNEDPGIEEEINLRKVLEEEHKETDVMAKNKNKILDHLRTFFSHIEKDYLIEHLGIDNRLQFQFITDFCDPILKIVIQFPKMFWHNKDRYDDPNKNEKLKQTGWKIIEFNSRSISLKDITSRFM